MLYIKALHIIFVVTWFAGIFYMPRLFIYNTEAQGRADLSAESKGVLTQQFQIMMKRLWRGITIPSAVLTAVFGPLTMYRFGYFSSVPSWLWVKLGFVIALYIYFFFLHGIFKQQMQGIYKHSSMQLRIWNEVATIFLVVIVFLVSVKDSMSWIYGLIGLIVFVVALMSAIRVYKIIRSKKQS